MSKPQAKTSLFDKHVLVAARTSGVPANILRAVIETESGGDPLAQSKAGAQGLMQLMPNTAQELGVTDAFDPEQNIMAGAKYLKQLHEQFGGDWEKTIAAYNAGPGNVHKHGGVPPFKETQEYVRKVGAAADRLNASDKDLSPLQRIQARLGKTAATPEVAEANTTPLERIKARLGSKVAAPVAVESSKPKSVAPSDQDVKDEIKAAFKKQAEGSPIGLDQGDLLSIFAGVSEGSGLKKAKVLVNKHTKFGDNLNSFEAKAETALQKADLPFKTTLLKIMDTLGLGDKVSPEVRKQVETQTDTSAARPDVTPQDIEARNKQLDLETQAAVEANPGKNFVAKTAAFMAGPGKLTASLAPAGAGITALAGQGAADAALFEGVTNENATVYSILNAAKVGGLTAGVVGGTVNKIKDSSQIGKNMVQRFLKTSNPRLADDFLAQPELRFATSTDDLINKATDLASKNEAKLQDILNKKYTDRYVAMTDIDPNKIRELGNDFKKSSFFKADDDANFLLRMADDLEQDTVIPVAEANKLKRIMWDQAKFTRSGDPSVSAKAESAYELGQRLREAIEQVIPEEQIAKINKSIGTGVQVQKLLNAKKASNNAVGTVADLLKLGGKSLGIGYFSHPAGVAAAAAGAAARTAPGVTTIAPALNALGPTLQKLPASSQILNTLFPALKPNK